MNDLERRVAEVMASPQSTKFLGMLVGGLSVAARGFYPEARGDPALVVDGLRGMNEALHVVGNQFHAEVSNGAGYPPEVFAVSLFERARVDPARNAVAWAVEQALTSCA